MAWTRFMDMHSGGSNKIDGYAYIYIEAPMDQAIAYFERRFGRDPHNVTCDCCGSDFSVSEDETIEQATGYNRNCAREGGMYVERKDPMYSLAYQTVEEYLQRPEVLVIRASEMGAK